MRGCRAGERAGIPGESSCRRVCEPDCAHPVPTGWLSHHQCPALHVQGTGGHFLAVHPSPAPGKGGSPPCCAVCPVLFCLVPPQLAESMFLSPGGGVWVGEGCVAGHPSPSSAVCGGSSLASWGMFTPQVNGMLPILPLLFPVLWVLATACGEARVLAQMSKASPSSLVGCSRAVEDDVRNKAS